MKTSLVLLTLLAVVSRAFAQESMNEVNGLSFKREYGETFNNSGDSDCLYFTNKVLIWLKKYSNPRQEFVCHVLDGNHVDCGTGAVGIYVSQNKTMYFSSAIPASLGGWLSTDEYTFVTIFDYMLGSSRNSV